MIYVTAFSLPGARFTVDKFRVRPYQKLLASGVFVHGHLGEKVTANENRRGIVENKYSHAAGAIPDVDNVVTAFHGRSNQALFGALKSTVFHVILSAVLMRGVR